MISSEDVRRVTFERTFHGYRCEDVHEYLKQVAESMDALAAENDDQQKKLVALAQRIEQYRADEDTLRTTMINAQRLGENVIHEAKQKAAEIIRTAGIKAEDREERSRDEVELAKQEIITLKSEADSFKRSLMEMYRKHINLISKMPEYSTVTDTAVAETEAEASAGIPTLEPQPAAQMPAQPYQPQQSYAAAPSYPPQQSYEPAQPYKEQDYYDDAEAQPLPAPEPEPKKVDTVEFAIAPHGTEPEEQPAAQPLDDLPELGLQPGAGLYDEEPPAPRKPARKPAAKRTTRKAKAPEAAPKEELDSPAFDNFEGVDFNS